MNFIRSLVEDFYMWIDDPLYHGGLWEDIIIGSLVTGILIAGWIFLL